ncbi:MAG: hypothetical protein OJF58_003160 [Enhydrobacter sp.]|nr:MAG: hypothetical protein OJF58_003160 [Enhydrobacter sp.]
MRRPSLAASASACRTHSARSATGCLTSRRTRGSPKKKAGPPWLGPP